MDPILIVQAAMQLINPALQMANSLTKVKRNAKYYKQAAELAKKIRKNESLMNKVTSDYSNIKQLTSNIMNSIGSKILKEGYEKFDKKQDTNYNNRIENINNNNDLISQQLSKTEEAINLNNNDIIAGGISDLANKKTLVADNNKIIQGGLK